jgi:hypothetical protein
MTEVEVMATLQASGKDLKTRLVMGRLTYFDGTEKLRTPDYLDWIEAAEPGSTSAAFLGLQIFFAAPPNRPTVVLILRNSRIEDPPTRARFVDALKAKYGPPTEMSTLAVLWDEPGKPQCNRNPSGGPDSVAPTPYAADHGALAKRLAYQRKAWNLPPDFTQCGAYLVYRMHDPVRAFEAAAMDIGAMVTAQQHTDAWLAELKKDAVQKRNALGTLPKL